MSKELIVARVFTVLICVVDICCVADILAYSLLGRPLSIYLLGWVLGVLLSALYKEILRWDNLKELKGK
jgi:hypothetical protein